MFLRRVVAPDRGALALEGQADHPAGALRVLLGHRGVDLGALEEDRAEHVLLGAVLLAGDQRQGRVVVAAQRVLRGAVQRAAARPAGRSGRCSAGSAGPARWPRPGPGRTRWAGARPVAGPGPARAPRPGPGRRRPAGAAGVGAAGVGRRPAGSAPRAGRTAARPARPGRPRPAAAAGSAAGRGAGPGRRRRSGGSRPDRRARPGRCRAEPGRRAVPGAPGGAGRRDDRAADDLAEPQLRGLAQRAGLLALLAGHGDRQVGAVQHHLGAADAEPVDPLLDDLLGLQQLLAGRFGAGLGAGHQRDPGTALQVDAQLGRGPAVTGEEHQRVEHDDDADERAQIAPGTDPPRGGCHG